LKEGAATDYANKEKLAKLLRFKSSHVDASKYTSLTDYVSRMPEGQSEIYYLSAPNKETALASPYYEVFESKSWEVLFLEDPRDEYVLDMVREFDGKKLVAAEKADVAVDDTKKKGGGLSEDDAKAVAGYLKETLGEKVGEVRSSQRLIGSPAAVKEAAGAIPASMRRMLKAMGQDEGKENDAPDLEINPDHPIIVRLNAIRGENAELASQIASQVFDNAMVGAGLMEDPRTMLTRLNALLETLLTK
jgi:molecular chaperone HtpG